MLVVFTFIWTFLALAMYATTFWHLWSHLWQKVKPRHSTSLVLLTLGLSFHLAALWPHLVIHHALDLNLFNVLSLTSWLMLAFSVIFSSYRPILALNILAIPVAALGLIADDFGPVPYTPVLSQSLGLNAHILLSLAAYCLLLMAAIAAILLHFQHRELKHQTSERIWVNLLPPLQTMERLLFEMLNIGFILLTIALFLGVFTVDNLLAQHLVHKTVFSVISWIIFAVLLLGHWRFGWRGQRAVRLTLWGFSLLFIGFLGSKFVLELILHKPV